jgi:hypothetical protein
MDYIFRPTLLSHFRFNYGRRTGAEFANLRLGPNTGEYAKSIEIPGTPTYSQGADYTSYKLSTFGGYNNDKNDLLLGRTWDAKEGITWLKGRHSVGFGFEYLRVSYHNRFCNTCAGSATFTNAATANPSVNGTSGSDLASFLLGVSSAGSFNYPSNANNVYPYYAAYIQDDFKISTKLTLNIGLRYDLPLPKHELTGQNSNFDPKAPNPGAGNLAGALVFAGSGPGRTGRESLLDHRWFAFGPRLGFAYRITPHTVIRGGGAIFYASNKEDGSASDGVQGLGGGYTTPANYFSSGISMVLPNGSNGAIAGFLPFAAQAALLTPPAINPSIVNFGSPNFYSDGVVGQIYDYNLTVERSIGASTLVRASYHANSGAKLQSSQEYNQLNPKYIPIYGNLLTQPLSSVINNSILSSNGYQLPYTGYPMTATLAQSLLPFPQYGSINTSKTNGGHFICNGLETQFQHRFSNGLWVQAAYTFSKRLGDMTSANTYVKNVEKDLTAYDRPHVFVVSYVYELPFGRGKNWGNNLNGFGDAVFGGWRVAAVQHYQSGTPFGVTCGQNLYGAGVSRCSVHAGIPLINPNWNPADPNSPYLNPAAFFQPANGVYGTLGAVTPGLRNPFQSNEDVALSKMFKLPSEKYTLEFRGSAFNIANRHLLGSIGTAYGTSTFGKFASAQTNLPRNVEFSLRFKF